MFALRATISCTHFLQERMSRITGQYLNAGKWMPGLKKWMTCHPYSKYIISKLFRIVAIACHICHICHVCRSLPCLRSSFIKPSRVCLEDLIDSFLAIERQVSPPIAHLTTTYACWLLTCRVHVCSTRDTRILPPNMLCTRL